MIQWSVTQAGTVYWITSGFVSADTCGSENFVEPRNSSIRLENFQTDLPLVSVESTVVFCLSKELGHRVYTYLI